MAPAHAAISRRLLALSPWAASLALHTAILFAAGGIVFPGSPSPDAGAVAIAFDEPSRPLPAPSSRPSDQPAPKAATLNPPPLPSTNLAPAPLPAADSLDAPRLDLGADLPLAASVSLGEGATAPELFGARGERSARRIVYVIDASGSMVAALPTVIRELNRSIDRLGPDQWFQVLVSRDSAFEAAPAPSGSGLIRASDANRTAVARWLSAVRAERRSDPLPAIERAISLRPDIIFLVSKGLGDAGLTPDQAQRRKDQILSRLDSINPPRSRHASIKVIQFFDPDAAGLMRAIGERFGGATGYIFISRKDLGLE